MSSSKATHPEISTIIRRTDQMYELLRIKQYDQALEDMILILMGLKPNDVARYKEDIQSIKDLYFSILKIMGRTASHTDALRLAEYKKKQEDMWNHWYRLNKILWEGNYLIDEGYRGSDIENENLDEAEEQ